MKRIPLSKGYFATVDDSDFELVSQHNWYIKINASGNTYALTTYWKNGRQFTLLITSIIRSCVPKPVELDDDQPEPYDNRYVQGEDWPSTPG